MNSVIVYCEQCGKEIVEQQANCVYIENNQQYIICCDKCYKYLTSEK